MSCRSSAVFGIILSAVVCLAAPSASAQPSVTVCTFDFEDSSQYGIPDNVCINNPAPPLFNRPGYGSETATYIVAPAACGEGSLYHGFGNDSLLTAALYSNNNTLRFSWVNPTDHRTWLRVPAHSTAEQVVLNPSPTVHLGVGSSIEMKVMIYAMDASESENPSGQLEFALCIRETGKRLPLGEDGGMIGDVEFVGITAKGFGSDADTPIGGVPVNHNAMLSGWTTLKWTFIDDGAGGVGVEVSVDGGTPVQKDIVGFTGNGVLSAAYNRGTLDSLAIRKPEADTTTKKWFVWIDDIVIDTPGDSWILPIADLQGSGWTELPGAGHEGTSAWRASGMDGMRRAYWKTDNTTMPTATELYMIEYFIPTAGVNNWQPIESQISGNAGEIFPLDPSIPWVGAYGTNHQYIQAYNPGTPGSWKAAGSGPHTPEDDTYSAGANGIYMWLRRGSWLYVKWDFYWSIDNTVSAIRLTQVTQSCVPPTVASITPDSGVQDNGNRTLNPSGAPRYIVDPPPLHMTITGADFVSPATVMLTQSGRTDIIGANVVVVDAVTITADFDLTAVAPGALDGLWTVVVTTCDTGTLPEAFRVMTCFDPPMDTDGDGDVDLADFGMFSACFNGPNRPWSSTADQRVCSCLDQDDDGDVDLANFGMFSACFNGPNRPPACAPVVPPGMVLIPSGEFEMGDHLDGLSNAPVHAVHVSAFYMDRYEVTKELWDTVRAWGLSNGYSDLIAGGGKAANHPVHSVNWFDCAKWANARSQKEGRTPCYYTDAELTAVYKTGELERYVKWDANGYRLPTEAEWEKAARGGASGHRFPWSDSDTIQHARANYYSSSSYSYDDSPTREYHPTFNTGGTPYTSPVGYFAPNGYGLYDMAGNAFEWCNDWYDGTYYSSSPYDNPRGPTSGTDRVLRGGGWNFYAYGCRLAARGYGGPSYRYSDYGFRCAAGT